MRYPPLTNFTSIFDREDFTFISDTKNLNFLKPLILYAVNHPQRKEEDKILLIQAYQENLDSFYNGIGDIHLKEGYFLCSNALFHVSKLFKEIPEKRIEMPPQHFKKIYKEFVVGLKKLLDGIRIAFDPDFISENTINIGRENQGQIARYILDPVEGYGRKFIFNNTKSKYSFARHIFDLGVDKLSKSWLTNTLHTLRNGKVREKLLGFTCLGDSLVRIHLDSKKLLEKQKIYSIYFIFIQKEHEDHVKDLKSGIGRFIFEAY